MNTPLSPPATAAAPDPALLLTIFLLTLLEFLQAGMIAFAAGPIMGEIGASPEEFSLATVVYACVAVSAISKQRWLVERLGWRNFVLLSLGLFVLGGAICATSGSYPQFLAGRAVMGLGGAAFMTTGRVLVNLIAPGPKRFTGIRYFATGLAAGIAFAPALASFAVAHGHWHGIFAMLIAVALVAAVLAALCLPTELVPAQLRSQSHPLVFMGLASGSFLLLYVLQRSQYDFFSDATMLTAGLGCGALALYYFFRSLRRHERPLLALKALRHPRYIGGVAVFALCYVLLGANNFMLPVLMQRTLGYSWETVGQVQSLGLSSALASWMLMSWAMPRWPGAKKFLVAGFVALAIFGAQLSRIDADVSLWSSVLPALACNGIFLIFVMATTAMHAFRDVQQDESVLSHAQQLKNMTAQFGTALGTAAATLLLQWRSTVHYGVLNNRFVTGDSVYTQTLHDLSQVLASRGAGPQSDAMAAASLAQVLGQNATLLACLDYFAVIAVVGVLGALAMGSQRLMK
jgi:DHA2 family multidrug resistance protein